MANVTITIPNALVPRLSEAMHTTFMIPEGETDLQAFKRLTAEYWRQILSVHETRKAEQEAWNIQQAAVTEARLAAEADSAGIV